MPRNSARKLSVKMTLDFALFRRQKRLLVDLHSQLPIRKRPLLEGIINLLDYIQNEAEKQYGREEVFGKA